MIIHLTRPAVRDERPSRNRGTWCDDTRGLNRAGCPSSVLSCTAWGFSCLVNYFASGELLPRLFTLACAFSQRTGGVFSVTLSVSAVFQLRRPRILRGMLPYGVRTFLRRIPPMRDSPAIICHRRTMYHNNESRKAGRHPHCRVGASPAIFFGNRCGCPTIETVTEPRVRKS